MSVFGRDAEFTMDYGGGISKNKIRLTVSGNPVDPFNLAGDDSDEEQALANILSRIGQRPKWKYVRGVNTIIYTLATVVLSLTSILDFAITATDVFTQQCVLANTTRVIEKTQVSEERS